MRAFMRVWWVEAILMALYAVSIYAGVLALLVAVALFLRAAS